MQKQLWLLFLLFIPLRPAMGIIYDDPDIMRRGDANNDNRVNITDPTYINNWLFQGGPKPPCMNQADANNDGQVNISDSTYLYNWLFQGGAPPPSPGPYNTTCTDDDPPYPGCEHPCS